MDADEKGLSIEIELTLLKNREASSDGAMASANKKLSAAMVQYAALRRNRYEVLSN